MNYAHAWSQTSDLFMTMFGLWTRCNQEVIAQNMYNRWVIGDYKKEVIACTHLWPSGVDAYGTQVIVKNTPKPHRNAVLTYIESQLGRFIA